MKRKPLPLYLVSIINAYHASGRIAWVYPFIGRISLNGGPRISYAEAGDRMRECLAKEQNKKELSCKLDFCP